MIIEILLISFLILNILDIYTTHKALSNSNNKEANLIVNFFITKLGLTFGLLAIKIPVMALIIAIYSSIPLYLFLGINVFYLIVIINNFIVINKNGNLY
jgi:hypothetical protein